jgi:hypothetical protein
MPQHLRLQPGLFLLLDLPSKPSAQRITKEAVFFVILSSAGMLPLSITASSNRTQDQVHLSMVSLEPWEYSFVSCAVVAAKKPMWNS